MKKKPLLPLSASAEALLPAPGESVKCSVHAVEIAVNPAGTAISAACVIVVDTPLPWPKPVFQHNHLAGVDGKPVDASGGSVRVLASVPGFGAELSAYAYRQTAEGTVAVQIPLNDRTAVSVIDEILAAEDPSTIDGAEEISPNAILVCTQGSHDVCCGSEGTVLAQKIRADYRLAGSRLFQVSHTGGHRFAPTAMTFPDGRMWAFIDIDSLVAAVNQTGRPADVAGLCRGSWEAPNPRCQAAEVAVLAQSENWPVGAASFEDDGDVVQVHRENTTTSVQVSISRDIPVIRCRAEGGLPAKPSKEYAARVLD